MSKPRTGRVVAVCASPAGGVPKYPQLQVEIGPYGVVGDYHAGPYNRHQKKGEPQPNRRQLTIVAQEVLDEMNLLLDIQLKPGDLAENVLVWGLGDLSDLQPGDRLQLGPVLVEVTAQNQPCKTVAVYHPLLVKHLYGRRGVTAIVLEPGTLRPGDPVTVLQAAAAPAGDE